MEKVQREYIYSSLSLGTRNGQQLNLPCSSNPRACGRLKYYLEEGEGFTGHVLGICYRRNPDSLFVSSPSWICSPAWLWCVQNGPPFNSASPSLQK